VTDGLDTQHQVRMVDLAGDSTEVPAWARRQCPLTGGR
jgi:hypothetical protein